MVEIVESSPSRLRLHIDTSGPTSSRDVGRILIAVDRAFYRFARDDLRIPGVRLEIVETGTGSWWATLIAAKEAYDILQGNPEIMPIFVNNIDATYRVLTDQSPAQTKKHFVDLVKELADVGSRIRAKSISFSSAVRTSINSLYFKVIKEHAVPDNEPNDSFEVLARKSRLPIFTDTSMIEKAGSLAQTGSLVGTIFLVDGSWYARPEGMSGVLLPLTLSDLARLTVEHGVAYKIQGVLLRSGQGHPVGIEVDSLTHLVPPPTTFG